MTAGTHYVYHREYMAVCDVWLTFAEDEEGTIWFPVRPSCKALDVDSPSQLVVIKNDSRLQPGLKEIPIPAGRGAQRTQCLRRREYAWWLSLIDPDNCKVGTRHLLLERQRALMDLADRVMFMNVVADNRIRADNSTSGELHFHCLRCGAPHCLIMDDNGNHLYVGEEVDS